MTGVSVHRGRDGEVEGQRTAVVGAEDERHPKPSERDRDAGNCIRVTSKRGPMASACFVRRKEQCCFETALFRTLLTLFFYSGIMYL